MSIQNVHNNIACLHDYSSWRGIKTTTLKKYEVIIVYKLSKSVLCEEIDGEYVFFDMTTENYFGANDVGGIIIENLLSDEPLDKIVEKICNLYNINNTSDFEEVRSDVSGFISDLLVNKIIEVII